MFLINDLLVLDICNSYFSAISKRFSKKGQFLHLHVLTNGFNLPSKHLKIKTQLPHKKVLS